jgi:hypothetical protein
MEKNSPNFVQTFAGVALEKPLPKMEKNFNKFYANIRFFYLNGIHDFQI